MSKETKLEKIAEQIVSDKACPQLAATATQLVFGTGNPDAKVVFIGEAPGKREDERGLPFVGAAGKFLDEMLGAVNLARDDIYITNIIKYRPPDNRDPLPEEIAAFMPYLFQQLKVINPPLIATLGRFAMNVFLPQLKISQVHGQPKRIRVKDSSGAEQSWTILPLYHPAAALYNGSMREILMADFQKLPSILKLLEEPSQASIDASLNLTKETKGT